MQKSSLILSRFCISRKLWIACSSVHLLNLIGLKCCSPSYSIKRMGLPLLCNAKSNLYFNIFLFVKLYSRKYGILCFDNTSLIIFSPLEFKQPQDKTVFRNNFVDSTNFIVPQSHLHNHLGVCLPTGDI